jgi:DNA-binding SARP family transcriptional activator/tetratricopeptide (TPR) repeat protein
MAGYHDQEAFGPTPNMLGFSASTTLAGPSSATMDLLLLGPVELQVGDLLVDMGHLRQRAVLAALAVDAGRLVTTETVVGRVWDDQPPTHARRGLHAYLSRIRQVLRQVGTDGVAPIEVLRRNAGYILNIDPDRVDGLRFEQLVHRACDPGCVDPKRVTLLRGALALWRGEPMAGIPGHWAATARDRWIRQYVDATLAWAQAELRQGNAHVVIGPLTDTLADHPLVEPLVEVLMRALHAVGRSADALNCYDAARQRLVEHLGINPGPALGKLHLAILRGEFDAPGPGQPSAVTVVRPDAAGSGGPDSFEPASCAANAPPCTLPRRVADFTGRQEAVARIVHAVRAADPQGPAIHIIDGMPGSGKTTLAVHIAALVEHDYPDGQLFIDLHGHSPNAPFEPAAALAVLMRQLGVPADRIPADAEERLGCWRNEVSGRRLLLVLDNAGSSEQVAPLLPTSAGCLALVTSRRRLTGLDGTRVESLPVMTLEEGVQFLARAAGDERAIAEPEATREVVRLCGYLPLAIRLAGARLAHRLQWRVADLAARLSDRDRVLTRLAAEHRTVASAFGLSYAQLSPAARRMFRLLSLHPGTDLDASAAAALTGLSFDESQRLLDELVDSYLVDEPTTGRYRLHDLLREYAGELNTSTDSDDVRHRALVGLFDFYLHASDGARRLIERGSMQRLFDAGVPRRPDLVEAVWHRRLHWFDQEWRNVVASVARAAQAGLHEYVWRLARVCWRYCFLCGHLDELIDTHERAVAAAEELQDDEALTSAYNYLASGHFRRGELTLCLDRLQVAMAAGQRLGNAAWLATLRQNLGTGCYKAGRYRESLVHMNQALKMLREGRAIGDWDLASVLLCLAVHRFVGEYEQALRHVRRSLLLAVECGDRVTVAVALGHIGWVRVSQGDYRYGRRLLTASAVLKRRIGDPLGEAEVLNGLGVAHLGLGEPQRAVQFHRQALEATQDGKDTAGQATALNYLGKATFAAGNTPAALDYHRQALALAQKIENTHHTAMAFEGIGRCLMSSRPEEARAAWLNALRLFVELDVPERFDVQRWLAGPDAA